MIRYTVPASVQLITNTERSLLTTPDGGKVAVDPTLAPLAAG